LSLGTGKNDYGLSHNARNAHWGLVQWVEKGNLLDLVLGGACEVANWQCERLLGDRYMRLDPKLPSEIGLDAYDRLEELELIGLTEDITTVAQWIKEEFLPHGDDDIGFEVIDHPIPGEGISNSSACSIL